LQTITNNPKAGGSSIKDALGGCHRFVQATEFGVTDGHIEDTVIAVVYPKVPGGADTDRSPFVNIDSSTVAGIQRAKSLGFADSQLADIVVSPFVFECNDLFTQTARGRLFSVFRHPIERAISMFYYIQVAVSLFIYFSLFHCNSYALNFHLVYPTGLGAELQTRVERVVFGAIRAK
jgi:hypothetical protein